MGGRRWAGVIMGIVLGSIVAFSGTAAALFANALDQYRGHEFDKAIEAAKGDKKDLLARLIMALAYTERYNIYKDKADKETAATYLKMLEVDMTMQNVDTLMKVLNVSGNPNGNKEAVKLLKQSFKSAKSTPEDILHFAKFVGSEAGPDATELALSEIESRLKPVREYVAKGGAMPGVMKDDVFTDKKLLTALVSALADKQTAGKATKCLVIIQDPALERLEKAEPSGTVTEATLAVKKAIQERLKKYPDGTWYNATGK